METILASQAEMKEEIAAGRDDMKGLKGEIAAGQEKLQNDITSQKDTIEAKMKAIESRKTAVENKYSELEEIERENGQKKKKTENNIAQMKDNTEEKIQEHDEERIKRNLGKFGETQEIRKIEREIDEIKRLATKGSTSEDFKYISTYSRTIVKLETYDGKTLWKVYNAQFTIVADANGWIRRQKPANSLHPYKDNEPMSTERFIYENLTQI